MFTQEQYLALQQRTRQVEVLIELLNQDDATIAQLEGTAEAGNINIQADSTYRRSGSMRLIVNDSSLIPKPDSKIWFNKKIRIKIGLKHWSNEIIWFNQGIFLMQDVSLDNSSGGRSISISFSDLMGLVDGTQNGNLTHEVRIVPEGVKVSEALRSTLSQLGKVSIDDIVINNADAMIPYEISVPPNSTTYDLSKTLLDLYMGMEMFYNAEGFLIIQKIKDRKSDPVLWDFTAEGMNLAINQINRVDFANVRNSIYLWGKKKDSGETIKWVYRNRYSRRDVAEMNLINNQVKGDICHVLSENISYVWNSGWKALNFTVPVEFNIESIGVKNFAYTDEKIAEVEQAMLRAEYELKTRCNLAESISMTCVPLYGLTVNSKVKIKDEAIGIDGDYIVKSVSLGLTHGDSMSIQAEKIYY